jgi:hypothetical protein
MLLCDVHHRLVDKEDVAGHPEDRLLAMKAKHEHRVAILTNISEDKQTHILLYGAKIGEQDSPLSYREAALAIVPDRYPADPHPISIGLQNCSFSERDEAYWAAQPAQIRSQLERRVKPLLSSGEISHLSIFALAPQPLLMLLGSLLTDIHEAEVFQRRREPKTWKWATEPTEWSYDISEPEIATGDAALIFSLTGTVAKARITSVLGPDIPIWHVSVPVPHNDFLVSRQQAAEFRRQMRSLMDRIKSRHGETATIHAFPVMPVCLAVEFGRILMPKADLPVVVYDQTPETGTFVKTLTLNSRAGNRPS